MKKVIPAIMAAMCAGVACAAQAPAFNVPERFKGHPLFTTRHCSVNFGFLARRGYFSRPEIFAQAARIKAAGANWVTLNTHFCQEKFYSTKMFLDFDWSSGEVELEAMIKELHRQGLHVILKPCLTTLDSSWMGHVRFPEKYEEQIQGVRNTYWTDWFNSLRECLAYFGQIAERNGVEAMMIGAEYSGTLGQDDEWRRTAAHVRKVFSGPITYEFTPPDAKRFWLGWFDALDFLAYSTYPPGVRKVRARKEWSQMEPVKIEEMMEALAPVREEVAALSRRFGGKPIVFTEIGTRSCRGCVNEPWEFLNLSPWDGEEQANYMEAVFRTMSGLPCWLGLSWWKWDETQRNRPHFHVDPLKDRGFTIDGKPASAVLKRWADKGL